jgi:sugar lactone lactonase YvrE
MPDTTQVTYADGFSVLESPRWHDGQLYVTDMHPGAVVRVDAAGAKETVAEVAHPMGTGFLPDGSLLIATLDGQVHRHNGQELSLHADLSTLGDRSPLNDMAVDSKGRAYVGQMGFDLVGYATEHITAGLDPQKLHEWPPPTTVGSLYLIDTQGLTTEVATGLSMPNGIALLQDETVLVVAETFGRQLTAYDVDESGNLSNRRLWAALNFMPDGISADTRGNIWVADIYAPAAVLIAEGGTELQRIPTSQTCFSVLLAGPANDTLFICTAPTTDAAVALQLMGAKVEVARLSEPEG